MTAPNRSIEQASWTSQLGTAQTPGGKWLLQQQHLTDVNIINAQLQIQLGQQSTGLQNSQNDLVMKVPALGVDTRDTRLGIRHDQHYQPLQPRWPPLPGALNAPTWHSAGPTVPLAGDSVNIGLGENFGMRSIVDLPSVRSKSHDMTLQGIALGRSRREICRLQNELGRSEHEVLRQKSLRESERQEFMETKGRLKQSWANDRDDFARVKNSLKLKNAEHHAHSGRISQQLKECEACNRILREVLARQGIVVPVDLEAPLNMRSVSSQLQSLIGSQAGSQLQSLTASQSSKSLLGNNPTPIALSPKHERGSLDSYLRQSNDHQTALTSRSANLASECSLSSDFEALPAAPLSNRDKSS